MAGKSRKEVEATEPTQGASHEVTKSHPAALQESQSAASRQTGPGGQDKLGTEGLQSGEGNSWVVGEGEGSRMQVIMDTFSADTEQCVMLSTS